MSVLHSTEPEVLLGLKDRWVIDMDGRRVGAGTGVQSTSGAKPNSGSLASTS